MPNLGIPRAIPFPMINSSAIETKPLLADFVFDSFKIADPMLAIGALELAELMIRREPPLVRKYLCRESAIGLAQYLARFRPDYCRAVTA